MNVTALPRPPDGPPLLRAEYAKLLLLETPTFAALSHAAMTLAAQTEGDEFERLTVMQRGELRGLAMLLDAVAEHGFKIEHQCRKQAREIARLERRGWLRRVVGW